VLKNYCSLEFNTPLSCDGLVFRKRFKGILKFLIYVQFLKKYLRSRDSSVGISLGYGLDDRGSGVQFLVGAGNFSPHHRVQNDSWAHPASYPMGIRGSFPGGKADGA
jgi:hypothetical protein